MDIQNEWYVARLVWAIRVGNSRNQAQFEEQWRMIQASSETEAHAKAAALGAVEDDTFLNESHHTVRWEFIGVTQIRPLTQPADGAELFSLIREHDNGEGYRNYVTSTAKALEESYTYLQSA
jgi:hypothetical protein